MPDAFSDLTHLVAAPQNGHQRKIRLGRTPRAGKGRFHLHPAYAQHEYILVDGLHAIQTFYVPRTSLDDEAVAITVLHLRNRTDHPIGFSVVASLDLRGETERDLQAEWDPQRKAMVAWNRSHPDWVRYYGADEHPSHYAAGTDEEQLYAPFDDLSDEIEADGDLTGALQFQVTLLPHQTRKIRLRVAFSPKGRDEAAAIFERTAHHHLIKTVDHYRDLVQTGLLQMPDSLLSQAVQWAKANVLRPLARYPIGLGVTNDPGRSTRLVGRDTAWYVHGCDWVYPEHSCALLDVFIDRQRDDGVMAEWIDANEDVSESYDFNINDDTTLFVMAASHHVQCSGHKHCVERLYEASKKACELILRCRDERGLVICTANGTGGKGIAGWRNVLQYEQINGAVTELNCEAVAALRGMAHIACMAGHHDEVDRWRGAAEALCKAINEHLIDPQTQLYVRNIDLEGRVFTQATVDLVFPLICEVADTETRALITARLTEPDFMSADGIRALPTNNPRYDPYAQSGCLGGVWPGATWWYAMGAASTSPAIMAENLRRSYWHLVADPLSANTVPGQFSEWMDGQTLVNRGMRLSPWEAPRFLWAAFEGLAGVIVDSQGLRLDPKIPADWQWLRLSDLPVQGRKLSFFLARQPDGLHVYTSQELEGSVIVHQYQEVVNDVPTVLANDVFATCFRQDGEVLVCIGSSLNMPTMAPFMTHKVLHASRRYRVERLSALDEKWRRMGEMPGTELQRITVRLDAQGYMIYRFTEVS